MQRSHVTTSSHIKRSPVGRSASRRRFPMLKEASLKSITRNERSLVIAKATKDNSSSIEAISPTSISGFPPFVSTVSFKTVLEFFHVQNLSNASRDEAIFLHILYSSLATQARLLAAILPGSVQRPLRELFAAMCGPGKSYTKRSAKPRPLSGSPASSRKRL